MRSVCPAGPTVRINPGTPTFHVAGPSTAAGGPVFAVLSVGASCAPGSVSLPRAGGVYAPVSDVLACGGNTNQSIDVLPGRSVSSGCSSAT